jgi:hypothetical protein
MNISELIQICQDSSKLNDWRVTHIILLKASNEYFKANKKEENSILIVCIRGCSPILCSWSFEKRVSNAYTRAKGMCATFLHRSNSNSCIIVWNDATGSIKEFAFNVDKPKTGLDLKIV